MANKHAAYDLAQMQSLPLEAKILMAKRRIQEWYDYWDGGVYVSFSGGKDSTVLLHLVRSMYPDVQAVFVNTGLEYPEIQAFAKQHDNVTILRPSMSFNEVLREYGYPMIGKDVAQRLYYAKRGTASALRDLDAVNSDGTYSKFKASHYGKYKPMVSLPIRFSHKCCLVMKEAPLRTFERQHHMHPIMGTMATESMRRKQAWMAVGCNAFEGAAPSSKPLSVWTEQDILRYLMQFNVPYCSIYGEIQEDADGKLYTTGATRTGCIFCGFGCHHDKAPTRFQRLKQSHPKQYEYCINGGRYGDDGIWKPNSEGLGMGHVFDELNKLYGENFVKYK